MAASCWKIINFRTSDNCTNNRECIRCTSIQDVIQIIKTKIIQFFNKSSNKNINPRKRTENINSKKQLPQRLPTLISQVHADNKPESQLNAVNEIWKIGYSLYEAKKIKEGTQDIVLHSFPHSLVLNLTDKMDLKCCIIKS